MTKYAIKDIEPNPFRHVDRYPINRDKVEALRESLRSTGYWGNVVARARPGGKAEVAYGHHRLAALSEEFGPGKKVDLIIHDLDDDAMLKMMARENMAEWATSAAVEHETVRATVEAFATGKITLPDVPKKTKTSQIRHAPSYTMGEDDPRARGDHAYTAQTLADFLGWVKPSGRPQDKVSDALAALQIIEDRVLTKSDFDGLTSKQAGAVVRETRRERSLHESAARYHREQAEQAENIAVAAGEQAEAAERKGRPAEVEQAEARRRGAERKRKTAERKAQEHEDAAPHSAAAVGAAVSDKLKEGSIGVRQASYVADDLRRGERTGAPPRIEDAMRRIMVQVNKRFDPARDPLAARLEEVVRQWQFLSDEQRKEARLILGIVAGRCVDYGERLYPKAEPMKTVKPAKRPKAAAKTVDKPGTKEGGEAVRLSPPKPRSRTRPKGEGAAPGAI